MLAQLQISKVFIDISTYKSDEFRFRAPDKIITICGFRYKITLSLETVDFAKDRSGTYEAQKPFLD